MIPAPVFKRREFFALLLGLAAARFVPRSPSQWGKVPAPKFRIGQKVRWPFTVDDWIAEDDGTTYILEGKIVGMLWYPQYFTTGLDGWLYFVDDLPSSKFYASGGDPSEVEEKELRPFP